MKKNTIVTAIFSLLIIVIALLFVFLSEKKDSAFWISLISTELSLLLLGGATTLYYSQKKINKKMKSATLVCAVYYVVAAAVINILFDHFFPIKTGVYIAIHVFLAAILCLIFATSVLFKKKRRHTRNKTKEVHTIGISSLLSEIQSLEASVSKLNQEIQIDIESMLLSLDKEVRYVTIPEGERGESFQIYLKEKITDLIPIMNELIETQEEDTQSFAKMIIDLKYLIDNPEIAPHRTLPSSEVPIEDDHTVIPSSSEKKIASNEIEMDVPISNPLNSINLELPETSDYKEILDFSDLEEISDASKTTKSQKKIKRFDSSVDPELLKNSEEIEKPQVSIIPEKEPTSKEKEKQSIFRKKKSKHPTEEELQAQVDEFFGRSPVNEEHPDQEKLSPEQGTEEKPLKSKKQGIQSAFTGETTPDDTISEDDTFSAEALPEKSIADTLKEKISEIEDLAKNISSFEDLERYPEEEKDKKEE